MILIAGMMLAMLVLIEDVLTLLLIIEQLECKPTTMEILTRRQQHSSIRMQTSNCKIGSRISKQHPLITMDVQANEERAKYIQAIQRGEGCVNTNRQLSWPRQCQNNIGCCSETRTGNYNHKMGHGPGASARDKTMSDTKDNTINNKCCCCRQQHT